MNTNANADVNATGFITPPRPSTPTVRSPSHPIRPSYDRVSDAEGDYFTLHVDRENGFDSVRAFSRVFMEEIDVEELERELIDSIEIPNRATSQESLLSQYVSRYVNLVEFSPQVANATHTEVANATHTEVANATHTESVENSFECSICMECCENDKKVSTDCSHEMCTTCMYTIVKKVSFLNQLSKCPFCREKICTIQMQTGEIMKQWKQEIEQHRNSRGPIGITNSTGSMGITGLVEVTSTSESRLSALLAMGNYNYY